MKKAIFFTLIFMIAKLLFAQDAEILTNKSIIELKNAGLSKSTILNMIATSQSTFIVDVKSIIDIKKNGIDEEIIDAMIKKSKQKSTNHTQQDNSITTEASNPIISQLQKQGTGVYYMDGDKLFELEPTVYSQAKQGSGVLMGLTYGISKIKSKASLSNSKANVQIIEKKPVFYFYFNSSTNSLNEQSSFITTATNPNEFLLIRFTITKNSREVITGTVNAYEGAAGGIDDANKQAYKYKKISQGIYQIYFENQIPAGEYGFMYAGAISHYGSTSPKVYDFGIH